MLKKNNFRNDGLIVLDSVENSHLQFVATSDVVTGMNGAFTVISAPVGILPDVHFSLTARLQIRNQSAKKIRVRFESGGVISNAWIDFVELNDGSSCDSGLKIWFVNSDIVIIDVSLVRLLNDSVRLSLHAIEPLPGNIKYSFYLENYTCSTQIGAPAKKGLLYHSMTHAGRAPELCKGIGLEIGSLHKPLPLDACVIHVDRFSTEELKCNYAKDKNISIDQIRQVQVAWKDGVYPFFDNNAFDFVVNSHVLEHVCNPGRQIMEWLRVIRPGGVLYMIVPDKNYCFDRKRQVTPIQHLLQEFKDNISEVSIDHYYDYMINTSGEHGHIYDCSDASIEKCYKAQNSIHVHTFDPASLREFIDLMAIELNATPIHYEFHGLNMHCALRKL